MNSFTMFYIKYYLVLPKAYIKGYDDDGNVIYNYVFYPNGIEEDPNYKKTTTEYTNTTFEGTL